MRDRGAHRNSARKAADKSQKRIYEEGATYFITTVTHRRHPYLHEPILAELFICDLWFGKALKEFELYGYTVIPNHVHLMFEPMGKTDCSQVMGAIKRNASRDINDLLSGKSFIRTIHQDPPIGGGDSNRRLHMLQANCEIAKQRYPNLDFDTYAAHFYALEKIRRLFIAKYGNKHESPKFKWQSSFHDHVIRDERDFDNHLDYISENAVRHGLVDNPEDWPFMWIEGMPEPRFANDPPGFSSGE